MTKLSCLIATTTSPHQLTKLPHIDSKETTTPLRRSKDAIATLALKDVNPALASRRRRFNLRETMTAPQLSEDDVSYKASPPSQLAK